jgi:hypothetical protein
LAGIVLATALLVFAGTADAYRWAAWSGRPGKIAAKKLQGYNYSTQAPFIVWPSGKIYRSPAAPYRMQIICATYVIYDWNYTYGRWYVSATAPRGRNHCWDVYRGQYLNMPSIPRADATSLGRYRGMWRITWWANAPTYRRIGYALLDFKDPGDYACYTNQCQVFYSSPQDRYYLFFPGY